jgi:hypothetical protein
MWSVYVVDIHVTVNFKQHRMFHKNAYNEFMASAAVKLTYIFICELSDIFDRF